MSPTDTMRPADPEVVAALQAACHDVGTRATDRLAGAHGDSQYLLTPQTAAPARDVEVARILAASHARRVQATFRPGARDCWARRAPTASLFRRISGPASADRSVPQEWKHHEASANRLTRAGEFRSSRRRRTLCRPLGDVCVPRESTKPQIWQQAGDVMTLGIDGPGVQRQTVMGPR